MAAPRPKKTTVVKKKPPVVKKKPSFLKKDTPRPARDLKAGDLRSQALNNGKPQAAQDLKSGDMRSQSLKGPPAKAGIVRGLVKKLPVVGAALGFIADAAPAGEGSTKDKYSTLKKKYSSAIGPDKYKRKGGEGLATYSDIPRERTVKYNPGDYAKYRSGRGKISMSGGGVNNPSGKSSGEALRRQGAGTYTAPYDVKAKKSGTSKAASVAPAAGSNGTSQATKKKSRSPTKYQRESLAMEQRKSPSGKPKKSIFSLFRKG